MQAQVVALCINPVNLVHLHETDCSSGFHQQAIDAATEGDASQIERLLRVLETPYDDQLGWASVATLNGLPATAVPIGRSPEGLPIGVQIIGGYLQDRTTIAFAGLIEREFGGFIPPPSL